jgi:hypothetical protein
MDYQNAYILKNELRSTYRPDMTNGVVYEGDNFLARLSARDPEKQPVEYLLIGGALPKGAFLDPSAGTITGRLTLEHFDTGESLKGDHTWFFTVGASDGVNIEPQDFQITVKHINEPVQWDDGIGGPVLELYEGNSIAQATVFTGTQLYGSTGNTTIRANAVALTSTPVSFNTSVAQTARDICNAINSHSAPTYTAIYLAGNVFKVANSTGHSVTVSAQSNGNMVVARFDSSKSLTLIDGLNNPTSDAANAIGWKINGAHDPEYDYDPISSLPITYSANGVLFDREDPSAVLGSTLTVQSNGVITGSLPPLNGNSGQIVGKAGGSSIFNVFAYDGEYYAAREFALLIKNTNQPPVFNPLPVEDLGTHEEQTFFSQTFHAFDPDGDTLTWSISNFTVDIGGVDVPFAANSAGLSFNPSTGTLSGILTNANIPPDENISNVVWYIASPNGVSASPADSSYYVWDSESGVKVFQSKPGETLFVTTAENQSVSPTIGQKYRITYSIRLVSGNNQPGLPSYVRPAFDGFPPGPPTPPTVLGQRSGPGYVSSINNVGYDFFDPNGWGGGWVALTCDYTVGQSFGSLRGRIRLNRTAHDAGGPPYWNGVGYTNRTDGPPYPNAVYQMRGYSITLRQSATYKFTISVTDGQYTVSRNFRLTVGNQNLPPSWVTNAGLGSFTGNDYVNIPLYANDPEGGSLVYTQTGGSVAGSGASLQFGSGNSSVALVGTLANSVGSYSFTLSANDGVQAATRTFSFNVTPAAGNIDLPPVWITPAGNIGSGQAGTSVNFQVQAQDPEGQTVTYSTGDPLGGLSLNSSTGAIVGTMPSAGTYTFTIQATANAQSTPRTFNFISTVAPDTTPHEFAVPGTYNNTYTVQEGITSILVDWLMAGGGGGGTGTQVGPGGGGGGGGSGGYQNNLIIPVTTGDTISVVVGAGGAGGIGQNFGPYGRSGSAGGDTVIYRNGVEIYRSFGGQGGQGCVNINKNGTLTSPGGTGGAPNGNPGGTGAAGTSDYASSTGGDGASSPLGAGGQGGALGYGHVEGNPGTGFGAGGGGGGSYDRSGPHEWNGGNGTGGYVKFTPQL